MTLAARAREELTVAGARPRRDALRGRDALTSSELRVARMAAGGATNRQIAEALFITLRTVETHLTSSYAKLGIASRRELATALDAHALEPEAQPR
jgi:DNA-binding NarL/FixJ family response regulator